jgi:hypothetical protein
MAMRALRIYTVSAMAMGLLAILSSCKSTGVGEGASDSGDVRAHFIWQQAEPSTGMLTATLKGPSGLMETYQGKFYQITSNSEIDTLGPLWHPWHPGWGGWAYWDPEPAQALVTHYTGHVLANLAGPDGKRIRCEFQLIRANEGMKDGGQGRCQLASGKTIRADFSPS